MHASEGKINDWDALTIYSELFCYLWPGFSCLVRLTCPKSIANRVRKWFMKIKKCCYGYQHLFFRDENFPSKMHAVDMAARKSLARKKFGGKMYLQISGDSSFSIRDWLSYYLKFSRHVNFATLRCAYFATLRFRYFAKFLYFELL